MHEHAAIAFSRPRAAALAAAALAAAFFSAGCVSVPSYTGKRLASETRRYDATGMLDARVLPVVSRDGDAAIVGFKVSGVLTNSCTVAKVHERTKTGELSVGLFPGAASDDVGLAVGATVHAVWYNVCMLGTPTLNGLLFEWFRPPDDSMVLAEAPHGLFRRSALVGCHRSLSGRGEVLTEKGDPSTTTETVSSLFLPVGSGKDEIAVELDGRPMAYVRDGVTGFSGIRLPGAYKGFSGEEPPPPVHARIKVPKSYGLKSELRWDEEDGVEIRL